MAAWRKKVGYCYPSGLEKTLCKWYIYVPLVTKKLIEAIAFRGSVKTFFSIFVLCYGSTWSATLLSVQKSDFQYVSRIEDTAGRVLGFLKASTANGRFPLAFLHACPYRIRAGVQTITPLIYRIRIFLKTLDATRSVRYLSPLQPETSWSGRNEW